MEIKKSKILYFNLIIISVFSISLFTKSFSGSGGILGIKCLLFGGLSVVLGIGSILGAWAANIFYFLGLLLKKEQLVQKLFCSILSILLGLLALNISELPLHDGSTLSPVHLGIGFYFWIGSFTLLFIKNLMIFNSQRSKLKHS